MAHPIDQNLWPLTATNSLAPTTPFPPVHVAIFSVFLSSSYSSSTSVLRYSAALLYQPYSALILQQIRQIGCRQCRGGGWAPASEGTTNRYWFFAVWVGMAWHLHFLAFPFLKMLDFNSDSSRVDDIQILKNWLNSYTILSVQIVGSSREMPLFKCSDMTSNKFEMSTISFYITFISLLNALEQMPVSLLVWNYLQTCCEHNVWYGSSLKV